MDLLQKMLFLFFVLFLLLRGSTGEEEMLAEMSSREDLVLWGGYGEEKLSNVVISGKILCHASAGATANHPRSQNPVSGAMVAIFCSKIVGSTRNSCAKGSTDSYGEFIVDLPSNLHAVPNLERICHVEVLHIPMNSPCWEAFTGQRKGIDLVYTGEGVRSYTTGTIRLTAKPSQRQIKEARKKERPISAH